MSHSQDYFEQAQQAIPGGVNSPVRAFKSVGGTPKFIESAKGAYLFDVDGDQYIDYVGSWGPMILGHSHPEVIQAVKEACDKGLSFGAPTLIETKVAEEIKSLVPSLDLVRMVNSGTEATMSAIRLARGYTSRNKIIKFEGCYHGHVDSLLVKAGSGALTLGVPTSPGIPASCVNDTVTLNFNDCDQIVTAFEQFGNQVACIIVEPIAGNMNCIPPTVEFLQTLRRLCDEFGALLIFDEVMTGFRVALGGAQSLYNITPDITTFGKIIGGGMPVGAYGGKNDIMQALAPNGPVYQAGTLSGNPIAMTAGLTTLKLIQQPGFYEALEQKCEMLCSAIETGAKQNGIPLITQRVGGMFGLFFTDQTSVNNFQQATACNTERFSQFFHHMLNSGIYLAPSAYEAGFISAAHSEGDIEKTVQAAQAFFRLI